jgi:hypothetical protein
LIEKALIVIIFMYAISMSILGAQLILADAFNITLTNFEGTPIESHIVGFINEEELNQRTANIASANFTGNTTYYDKIETFTTSAAYVAWELITLLTGTYIFQIMALMGVPIHFVLIFVTLYILLLARAIIGYIRGI